MQSHIVCNITIYLQSEFSYMYPQLPRQKNAKSHWLQYYDLSQKWIFICIFKLLAKINAKSHFLQRYLAVAVGLTIVKDRGRKLTEGLRIWTFLNERGQGLPAAPHHKCLEKHQDLKCFHMTMLARKWYLKKMFPTFLCAMVSFRPLSTSPKQQGRLQKSARTILNIVKCNHCQYKFNISSDLRYHPTI